MLWRREFTRLRGLLREGGWLLLYGRRKTGKTFMTRLLADWSLYATVTRDGAVIVEEKGGEPRLVEAGEAARLVAAALEAGSLVVVDEFQRLPERLWQLLALRHPRGRLVLVASSLGVVERVLSSRSPLLGLVAPVRIDVIAAADAVASLAPRLGERSAVLWGVVLREPWAAAMPGAGRGTPWGWIAENAQLLYTVAQGLVGEVFTEEERKLTRLYEAVLRLLGAGVWDSRALATLLHQRGLLGSPGAHAVTGILDKLASMGLVAKTRLWRTRSRRIYYRHASPLLAIAYGLAERRGVDEYPVPRSLAEKEARSLYARELQFTLAELLADSMGGVPAYTILPGGEGDVDAVVLDASGRHALAAYEVKLGSCGRGDYRAAAERASRVGAERAGVVCLGGAEGEAPRGLEVLGPREVVERAKEAVRRSLGYALATPLP